MAITVATSAHGLKQNWNPTFVANLGGAPAVNDRLVFVFGGRVAITMPAGWTVDQTHDAGNGAHFTIASKTVNGTDPGDSNGQYTITMAGNDYCQWAMIELHSSVPCTWSTDLVPAAAEGTTITSKQLTPGTTTNADEYALCVAMFRATQVSALTWTLPDTTVISPSFGSPLTCGSDQELWVGGLILSAVRDLGTSPGTHQTVAWTTTSGQCGFGNPTYKAVATGGGAQSIALSPVEVPVSPVALGISASGVGTWTAGPAGDYVVTAQIDPFNTIAELSDENNERSITLTVGAPQNPLPDLVVTGIRLSPLDANGNVVAGTEVTPYATIRNQGGGASPAGVAHKVAFYLDNPTPGTHSDAAYLGWSDTYMGPLASGASIELAMNGSALGKATFTAPAAGAHHVQALVDRPLLIIESDDTNNWSTNYAITVDAGVAPPPPPPPGPGTREAMLWPGSAINPFNVSLGDETVFLATTIPAGGDMYFRTTRNGQTIYGAGYAVLDQTDNENHRIYIETGKVTAHDGFGRPGGRYFSDNLGSYGLKADMPQSNAEGAAGWPHIWGVLRQYDLDMGEIMHALNLYIPGSSLKHPWVAPAYKEDDNATAPGPEQYTGTIPIGTRCGIRRDAVDNMVSAEGHMLFRCGQRFGAFVSNRSMNAFVLTEATAGTVAFANRMQSNGDGARFWALLHPVAAGQCVAGNNYSGPGNRLVSQAPPPFAY